MLEAYIKLGEKRDDVNVTGKWRYYPDYDSIEVEITYSVPYFLFWTETRTEWVEESRVQFVYLNGKEG